MVLYYMSALFEHCYHSSITLFSTDSVDSLLLISLIVYYWSPWYFTINVFDTLLMILLIFYYWFDPFTMDVKWWFHLDETGSLWLHHIVTRSIWIHLDMYCGPFGHQMLNLCDLSVYYLFIVNVWPCSITRPNVYCCSHHWPQM